MTFRDFPVRELSADESVFLYHDSASSRAELSAVTAKLRVEKVAIVGLGGTGSYILDLIAKTPIQEIHLFDDDEILAHNAFRAPGAMSVDDLRESPKKVDYLAHQYGRLRRGIVVHDVKVSEEELSELSDMSFVFLSMDAGPAKRAIVHWLSERAIPFVDCGMGLTRVGNSLRGSLRVTASGDGDAGRLDSRISYVDVDVDEYAANIQTADLNMLNAALAVLKWKKLTGYYVDRKRESNITFALASNQLISGDLAQ